MVCTSAGLGSRHVRVFYFALLIVCVVLLCVLLLAHPSLSLLAEPLSVIQPPVD